ncbi:HlyD family secretion protein [Gemmobacter megaterium]|uniref:Membrane fusion protein (MFP) family protein n=2 Tax=Gemmobacter megaterium TaxID=1086013 RepID=A0A1N7MK39_9RHOB|nr:HlyD family type I secretion periplasmic adaptor subunit [Gemmobacter megaterium]SIS86447.1 HlyD family secretion protein [Gemmobacter megaterium]
MTQPQKSKWSVARPMALGLITSAVLIGGTVGWGMMTTITGAVVTSGQLEVDRNRQIVQHADGGTVQEIHVTEGAFVEAGDVLMILDGTLLRSELTIVETQFFEILARRGRLEAERDDARTISFPAELVEVSARAPDVADLMTGQERLFSARAETLTSQIEQLQKRKSQTMSLIEGIDAQREALTTQRRLIAEELASQRELLSKGLAQVSRVLGLEREEARLAGQVGELTASRAQAEGRITETEIEILRMSSTRREEASTQLRDIGYRELELAERRRALHERMARLDIRAPVSGVVLGLRVTTPRAVLRAADPVLFIIPQDRPLVIATRVPTVHIDQVRPGQEAKVVFSAFSMRTTPEVFGTVTIVSPDVLVDEATNAPYYRAEIELNPGELAKLGDIRLIPGMPVEAFIRTDERTPVQFLTKPFTDYFNRAFRES